MNQQHRFTQPIPANNIIAGMFPTAVPMVKAPEPYKKIYPEGTMLAVYPTIPGNVLAIIMNNYRARVAEYKERVTAENIKIKQHNQEVKEFLARDTTSEIHRIHSSNFPKHIKAREKAENRKYTSWDYNNAANDDCALHGPIIYKVKIQHVKFQAELVFQNFIILYRKQMTKRNDQRKRTRQSEPLPLPVLDTNSAHVTNQKRNGEQSIAVCNKTVRSHRQRLEEAGIFINPRGRGRYYGSLVEIDPSIMAVLDEKTGQIVSLENQPFTNLDRKELPNIKSISRSLFIDKKEKKENATHFSHDKVQAEPAAQSRDHGMQPAEGSDEKGGIGKSNGVTPLSNVAKSGSDSPGAAAENVKVELSPSEKLFKRLLPVNELDARMRTGLFDHYTPIPISNFWYEEKHGTLTEEQLRKIVLQDFIKASARLYREMTVLPGTWANTHKMMMDEWMITKGRIWNKRQIVEHAKELRWRLQAAHLWYTEHEMQPLYPINYFDLRRTTKQENGFEYTSVFYKNYLKEPERKARRKQKRDDAKAGRAPEIDHSKKFEAKFKQFVKGLVSPVQLYNYVENNLPPNFLERLGYRMNLHQAQENAKYLN